MGRTSRLLTGTVVAAVLSVLALAVVVGDHRFQGPVVVVLSYTRGLHLGDLAVVVAWVLCLGLLSLLVAAPHASR